MAENSKLKKRGFVMNGGGAKGLYEAGVIYAFHITGMEFDVITGSSIGAMNSIFYAEYLLQKKNLTAQFPQDPDRVSSELDDLVKAYHHAWLLMPDKRLVDDSASGPIGQLKDDLLHFNINMPTITELGWWWTDPDRQALPPIGVWPALVRLLSELLGRLGSPIQLLNILRNHRDAPVKAL